MARHGKSIAQGLKKQIIFKFLKQQKSKAEIARELHISENTVYRWIARWDSDEGFARKRGQGRKPAITKRACWFALNLLVKKHLSAKAAAQQLYAKGHTKTLVSRTTLVKHVKEYAKRRGTPITCRFVRMKRRFTEQNLLQRYNFCRAHRRSTFQNVMFTDRCKFAFKNPGEKVYTSKWHYESDDIKAYTVNHPPSFNVYGGITIHGPTRLRVVTGTTNYHPTKKYTTQIGSKSKNISSQEYYDTLMEGLLPDGHRLFMGHDWVLQQDNDPTHKEASKRAVQEWNKALQDQGVGGGRVTIMQNWPPNSPDLSIIENCWSITQARVAAMGCANFTTFTDSVEKTFKDIDPKPLFESIPKRIKQCLKVKGDRTPH
jgi:transposase